MKKSARSAVIYARVSTSRQADSGLPVESQIEQCEAKAKSIGAVVFKVFRDEGISGRTSKRPGFLSAMDYCEENRIDYFICWSSSRFARNHIDAALNKRALDRYGTKLVFVSQDFGESEESWMIESIVAIMDEQYSRAIAKDTRRSMAKNAADGFWNGGRAPFGYAPVQIGKRKKLAPVADEALVVKTIFRWAIDGLGQKCIAVRLNESGIGRRGRKWDKASVGSVLRSRAVIGQLVFNDRGTEIVSLAHEPILSEELFEMAQSKVAQRIPRNVGGQPRSEAAFSGLLFCGKCGQAMYTESATGRSGTRYHYYNCRSFLKGMGCENRRIQVEKLDSLLLNGICDRIFTVENIGGIMTDMKHQLGEAARKKQELIDALAGELSGVERRLHNLYETIEAGAGLELADIAPRLRALRARQESLKLEIERIDTGDVNKVGLKASEIEFAEKIFRDILLTAENPSKVRDFLSHVVQRVVVRDDFVSLEYLPERIVKAQLGGSQCEVRWLPDCSTLRTAEVRFFWPRRWRGRVPLWRAAAGLEPGA